MSDPAARLDVVGGNAAGQSLLVTDELIIGRSADGPGQLGGDEELSRSHARLSVDAGGLCAIEDLGSTNGTFVNGLRISAPQTLSEGDTIELGGTSVVVQKLPEPAAEAVTATHDVPTPVSQPPAAAPAAPPPDPTPVSQPPAAAASGPPASQSSATSPPASVASPAEPAEPAEEPVSPLVLNVHVDAEARRALLTVGDSETVRLVFEAGRWQVAGSQSTEEGTTA
jgi:predicted component of type VI protein secretion system